VTTQLLIRVFLPVLSVLGVVFVVWVRTKRPPATTPMPVRTRRLGWLDDDGLPRGTRWDGGVLGAL
jgi:hypothetical protein